jgi:type IV pilus assembly protein PilQ
MTSTQAVKRTLFQTLLAVCFALGASLTWAQNSIKSVSGSAQGEVEIVRIEFARELKSLPSAFATQNPSRIALDFPGLTGGMGRSTVEINQSNVQSANVVQTDDLSRVVLTLKRPTSYSMQLAERALIIKFEPPPTSVNSDTAATRVTELNGSKETLSAYVK